MNRKKTFQGPFKSLVVLGESTVEGGPWLAKPEERWADLLWRSLETAQESSLRYHNAGIGASVISPKSPGYEVSTKPSGAERLQKEILSRNPDLVVIAYGLNDMRAGMSVTDFKTEMKKIIVRIRAKLHPLIILVNIYHVAAYNYYPPFDKGSLGKTKQYNRMLKDLAAETGCAYADVWSAQGRKNHVIHQDTVHANKVGNMLIANKVFETVIHHAPGITESVDRRNATTPWTLQCLKMQTMGVEKSHEPFWWKKFKPASH